MTNEEKREFEELKQRCIRWRARNEKHKAQRKRLLKERRKLMKEIDELEKKYAVHL